MKKIFALLLCMCITFAGVCAFAQTPVYKDIENHWAGETIGVWSGYGVINGYDGCFYPDKPITRGDFATILNRIFLFDEQAENNFSDLDDAYYTTPILCLNKQGIINGFENNIRPNDYITREEAGTMLCKALKLELQNELTSEFTDESLIGSWAIPYMASLVNEGFFGGDNGYLRPKDNITRAETVTLLDNGIVLFDENNSEKETDKICVINKDNFNIRDFIFNKGVFITENIQNVTLENVSVNGVLYVLGDTENSVTLKNSVADNIEAVGELSVNIMETSENSGNQDEAGATSDDYSDIGGSIDEDYGDGSEYCPDSEENSEQEIPEEMRPTIETTLEDGLFQRNSKKVFDVIARDANGEKIECTVRCNDINIEPSWDDESKTSFTLEFSEDGEYAVTISAQDADGISQTKTYNITYEMAEYGEPIGRATVSLEAFTVGGGYLVFPVEIDVLEGMNCAILLDKFLSDNNLAYTNTGSLDGGFYLATVSDIPEFTPVISEVLKTSLLNAGFDVDEHSYTPGQLSEFDFAQGSGWMYSVNGVFPNVGFSEYYLQDGDVMRIQYTLAYGADIGGASAAGYSYAEEFYEIVNRDNLTKMIANIGIENCMDYMDVICKPDMTSDELDFVMSQLQ